MGDGRGGAEGEPSRPWRVHGRAAGTSGRRAREGKRGASTRLAPLSAYRRGRYSARTSTSAPHSLPMSSSSEVKTTTRPA